MGCCISRGKKNNQTTPKELPFAKEPNSQAKNVKGKESSQLPNSIIKLDKKPTGPQMKVIHSKLILDKNNDQEAIPSNVENKSQHFQESPPLSTKNKSETLRMPKSLHNKKQILEEANLMLKTESLENENNRVPSTGHEEVEQSEDNVIEVNEEHWLSKLKYEANPKPIKANSYVLMLRMAAEKTEKERQELRNILLPKYQEQLASLTGSHMFSPMAINPAATYIPMPFVLSGKSSTNINRAPTPYYSPAHPAHLMPNQYLGFEQNAYFDLKEQSNHGKNLFKNSMESFRKRNVTTPNLYTPSTSPTFGMQPPVLSDLARNTLMVPTNQLIVGGNSPKVSVMTVYEQDSNLEDESNHMNRKPTDTPGPIANAQANKIVKSEISLKNSMQVKINQANSFNAISEHNTEEDESIDNKFTINTMIRKSPHELAGKFNELRKRNLTELPARMQDAGIDQFIVKKTPENNEPRKSSWDNPKQLPHNQIEEIDDSPEDESDPSDYLGDKLFKLDDDGSEESSNP